MQILTSVCSHADFVKLYSRIALPTANCHFLMRIDCHFFFVTRNTVKSNHVVQWFQAAEKRQVMCLLNVIGTRGRAVYDAMQFAANGDNLKSAIVKKKFEEHCIPKQNELIERDWFNARTQISRVV